MQVREGETQQHAHSQSPTPPYKTHTRAHHVFLHVVIGVGDGLELQGGAILEVRALECPCTYIASGAGGGT